MTPSSHVYLPNSNTRVTRFDASMITATPNSFKRQGTRGMDMRPQPTCPQ